MELDTLYGSGRNRGSFLENGFGYHYGRTVIFNAIFLERRFMNFKIFGTSVVVLIVAVLVGYYVGIKKPNLINTLKAA